LDQPPKLDSDQGGTVGSHSCVENLDSPGLKVRGDPPHEGFLPGKESRLGEGVADKKDPETLFCQGDLPDLLVTQAEGVAEVRGGVGAVDVGARTVGFDSMVKMLVRHPKTRLVHKRFFPEFQV